MSGFMDFGDLAGDVVAFGGAVSNAHAAEALIAELAHLGLGAAPMVSTGDHCAYCAEPARTLALLRERGMWSIAGNCEESLGAGAGDCGCGFATGTACDLASGAWFAHAAAAIPLEARDWMQGLPRLAAFRAHGRRWGVLHGGASAVNRYVWPTDDDAVFAAEIALLGRTVGPVDAVLAGHCGVPFRREVGGRLWLNTGALGMPPHDGDRRVSYAIIRAGGVEMRRLGYDWRGAQAGMRSAGLVQGYDVCLETGWWPSEDILPAALRRAPARVVSG